MLLPKAWLSDCVTSRFLRSLCRVLLDLCVHQMRQAENHALQCTTAGPYNAISSTLLGVGSICGLVPDLVAFIPSAWLLAIELRHARPRLAKVLRRSTRLVGTIALLFWPSVLEKKFLVPSMAFGTADAF